MSFGVRRIYVEKKPGFDIEAGHLYRDLKENLGIKELSGLRIANRYDVEGIDDAVYAESREIVFAEPTVDNIYDESILMNDNERCFAVEYLPGQYDQRADSAAQCIGILTQSGSPEIRNARIIILAGKISEEQFEKIKNYCINPVDSREADMKKPESLNVKMEVPADIEELKGFISMTDSDIEELVEAQGYAMTAIDLIFCREYFKNVEKRNPTVTEIKVIDTYWSDHCRHTTFLTEIKNVEIEQGIYSNPIIDAFQEYKESRKFVYGDRDKDICLMDMAVLGMKELRLRGKLNDLDISEEINACSIVVDVDVDDKIEKYLVMFKNETHNHPTEIEPFGGAATCLGGAIRDPLSGRSYVYQAMRVTGSADPRTKIEDTIQGKLPQRKITLEAAHGYSSYGNQIGLATGCVNEIYDSGYAAKRMEIGAVIAAAPFENVVREIPAVDDVIILLGGRTGRDGCGGATGSSKAHTEESILTCGAEVQKGNAPTERKIQRLFRNPKVSKMIKRCNDFGAGGVSVAIGELAEGLEINLDAVPKKYEGLDGTELSISESQERMAVVVSPENVDAFIKLSGEENLEAKVVAKVTGDRRLKMVWRNKIIVDVSRDFLDTNGAKQTTDIKVTTPLSSENYFEKDRSTDNIKDKWLSIMSDLNICSQKGLAERFDSTIGAATVIMPFGGKHQLTPQEGMVAKIPMANLCANTNTGTVMTYGYNPEISKWSPFHGAVYSVVEAVAKVVALGGDYKKVRLTLQEYFEKLGKDPERWGKPFSALLGAFHAQLQFGIPAIGGKDSMSGSFKDMDVPPTLVTFAVDTMDVRNTISAEFKKADSNVILIPAVRDKNGLPDFTVLKNNFNRINELILGNNILSASTVKTGGIAEAIGKMSFGNMLGFCFDQSFNFDRLFAPDYGSIVVEIDAEKNIAELLKGVEYVVLGKTQSEMKISAQAVAAATATATMTATRVAAQSASTSPSASTSTSTPTVNAATLGFEISLEEMLKAWQNTLENVFKSKTEDKTTKLETPIYNKNITIIPRFTFAKPRVFIPAFPGTNCELDSARAFERAGAIASVNVFRNLTPQDIHESVENMAKEIRNSQIIMLPGGFSAGDEPEGSGKFIATVFRNPRIKEAVMELLTNRDGLMLGICNGFQALIKLGLVPYGEIRDIDENCPTLTYNEIGRHMSSMVHTKIVSKKSPWLANVNLEEVHTVAVSHGEGRFTGSEEVIKELFKNGQVATQYVDFNGDPTMNMPFNPNGSAYAIEGITSPDGRVYGKMTHSERIGSSITKNVPGNKDQGIFEAGVDYFK